MPKTLVGSPGRYQRSRSGDQGRTGRGKPTLSEMMQVRGTLMSAQRRVPVVGGERIQTPPVANNATSETLAKQTNLPAFKKPVVGLRASVGWAAIGFAHRFRPSPPRASAQLLKQWVTAVRHQVTCNFPHREPTEPALLGPATLGSPAGLVLEWKVQLAASVPGPARHRYGTSA